MEHEQDISKNIDQTDDIQDELSEDELTDVELDRASGGVLKRPPSTVKPQYIEMPPLFIQATR